MSFDHIILALVILLSFGSIIRLIIGPTVWDRLLSFNLFSSKVIMAATLIGVVINRTYMMDVALIYGVLGFIGTIMISRFIERKGDV